MQYFLGWRVIINRKILILHASMKKMMMGVAIALMMAVAFVACSSDDEERLEFNNINGGEVFAGDSADGAPDSGNGLDECHIVLFSFFERLQKYKKIGNDIAVYC